jgi:hypothetical protein
VSDEADPLDEAWARVLATWDDDDAHRRFVSLAVALGRLPEAGRRYREVRDGDPDRRASAERHIEKLFGLAVQTLEAQKTPPPDPRANKKLLFVAIGVALSLVGAVAWSLLHGPR